MVKLLNYLFFSSVGGCHLLHLTTSPTTIRCNGLSESKIVKHLSIFLATHLNHVNRKIRQCFLNFPQILTIEILEKHFTLALLFFNITSGLNKASKTKRVDHTSLFNTFLSVLGRHLFLKLVIRSSYKLTLFASVLECHLFLKLAVRSSYKLILFSSVLGRHLFLKSVIYGQTIKLSFFFKCGWMSSVAPDNVTNNHKIQWS